MASSGVAVERRSRTLVLTLGNGPANTISPALRRALLREIETADCSAIVLAARGTTFSSALPLEPDHATPRLADLCTAIAEARVPVVAALHGLVMGAGAELALAATARIASPGCRIALPEIALGLCPEAGTSRRLPTLVGSVAALRLLLTGRAVGADEALGLGLLGAVVDGPLLDEAIALAEALADSPRAPRPVEPAATWQAAIAGARRAYPRALPAVGRIIDCVEAALLLPPEAAQAFEAVTREDLEKTPEAAGLCAAVKAERRAAALPPAVARAGASFTDRIALSGRGQGLGVLARAAVAKGMAVVWLQPEPEASAADGQLPSGPLLRIVADPAALAGIPFQVHANLANADLSSRATPGTAVLVLGGAEGEMGLSIAPSGRACELSVLAEEAPDAIATAVAVLRRLGLPPLLVGQRPILGERVSAAGMAVLLHLSSRGVSPRRLGAALVPFGAVVPQSLQGGVPDPAAPPPDMTAVQIRDRWLAAMANEGLRLLDLGIARRPSDVDHAMVAGHGFPRWRGGPMHQADQRGLLVLRHDLRLWAEESPLWSPAPLLDRLIQDGLRLSALDR
ncbi:enoyl-CoA hydratase-related protein [Tabrizicola sp.]|uniref:enoyl-CoA hydratase-related protein n=1 Tax=Tabrizicola sp. TaxID=2005166 RepID=UPI002610E889|nr:enoyl-CoA hydratase-related protein [Tabrizicola sp.]MDM7930936.1 enoyl-CoA hydratase-related protein [Tabrizicola sp.]